MQNTCSVLIIGSGNLGIATGTMLKSKGHSITYSDISSEKISQLKEQGLNTFNNLSKSNSFDFIFICVPTPTVKNKIFLAPLKEATQEAIKIAQKSHKVTLIVIRSTAVPGTIEGQILPLVEDKAKICYFPSFMRERKGAQDELNPWITVIASEESLQDRILKLLRLKKSEVDFVSYTEAEIIKSGSNVFNATKISYFNFIYQICLTLGIDGKKSAKLIGKAAEGNWNANYGTESGYPFGGDCLPKDLEALISKLRSEKIDTGLLESVQKINKST